MKVLHSEGNEKVFEVDFKIPDIKPNQIRVKTLLCGVCRSDIGVYGGFEDPMPVGMFGHEGLGIVKQVGSDILDVKLDDIVATISDPAYAKEYNASHGEYVKVPEASPKYIIQPVACAINIFLKTQKHMNFMGLEKSRILLIGSGFMSIIIGQYCSAKKIKIDVLGNSHKAIWDGLGINLIQDVKNKYDVVIDLSSKGSTFDLIQDITTVESLICYASTPFGKVTTNFFKNCWNCHTFIMPSPRNKDFNNVMKTTVDLINNDVIMPSILWTEGYNRNTQYNKAFEDGLNRDENYMRGYLCYTLSH